LFAYNRIDNFFPHYERLWPGQLELRGIELDDWNMQWMLGCKMAFWTVPFPHAFILIFL
jgi:hypothetical protein